MSGNWQCPRRRLRKMCLAALSAALGLASQIASAQGTAATSQPQSTATVPRSVAPSGAGSKLEFKDAGDLERGTIQHLLEDSAWPRRAIAALRLERYRCEESRSVLVALLGDNAWQVRAFAVRALS